MLTMGIHKSERIKEMSMSQPCITFTMSGFSNILERIGAALSQSKRVSTIISNSTTEI